MADLIDRDALLQDMTHRGGLGIGDWHVFDVINEQPAVNRWIPCSERMPEQEGFYLVYFTFKDGTHATDITYINTAYISTGCLSRSITHWMPLPEPPEKE